MDEMHYSACGDVYNKEFTKNEYLQQIQVVRSINQNRIAIGDNGFRVLSLIGKIFQVIKGFFGFNNESNVYLINSEILKLLQYGEMHGYNDANLLNDLAVSLAHREEIHQKVKEGIATLQTKGQNPNYFKTFRHDIMAYHVRHRYELTSFWHNAFSMPTIPVRDAPAFGSTYLQLGDYYAEDIDEAYSYLKKAKDLYNMDIAFQYELAGSFTSFAHSDRLSDAKKRDVQLQAVNIFQFLQTVQQPYNRIKSTFDILKNSPAYSPEFIKQCISIHRNYQKLDDIKNKLNEWGRAFPNDNDLNMHVADALWDISVQSNQNFMQSVSCYESLRLKIDINALGSLEKKAVARMYYRMAVYETTPGYFSFIKSLNFPKAIADLEMAIQLDDSLETYKKALYDIYIKLAGEEGEKTRFTYDKTKHIEYLTKAYKLLPDTYGDNINTLIHLLLEENDVNALKIYLATQKSSYAKSITLEAEDLLLLSQELLSKGDTMEAHRLFEKASELSKLSLQKDKSFQLFIDIINKKIENACQHPPEKRRPLLVKLQKQLKEKLELFPFNQEAINKKANLIEKMFCLEDLKGAEDFRDNQKHEEAYKAYKNIIEKYASSLKQSDPRLLARISFDMALVCRELGHNNDEHKYYKMAHENNPKNPYYSLRLSFCASQNQYLMKTIECFASELLYRQWNSIEYETWTEENSDWMEGKGKKPSINPHDFIPIK